MMKFPGGPYKLLHLPTGTELLVNKYIIKACNNRKFPAYLKTNLDFTTSNYCFALCEIYKLYAKDHPNASEIDEFYIISQYFIDRLDEWQWDKTK